MNRRVTFLLLFLLMLLVVLGARVEYLTRSARYHRHEAARYVEMIRKQRNITPVEVDLALETAREHPDDARLDYKFRRVLHHSAVAATYQAGVQRPWSSVHEPPPPERTYED
jgi:hypothetical protein